MPEFFEKSPFSGVEKHCQDQGTSCHHFDSTDLDFAHIESEKTSFFAEMGNFPMKNSTRSDSMH
jgi:hypothetical protein